MCRFFARVGRNNNQRPMTNEELSKASGLAKGTIAWLSRQMQWDSISHITAEKFTTACNVDPENADSHWRMLATDSKAKWLASANPSQRKMMQRILFDLRDKARCAHGSIPTPG